MTIVDQINFIVSTIEPWAASELNGKVARVPNMDACWRALSNREGAARVFVMVDGEDPRVNFPGGEVTAMVERGFSVVISKGRGLKEDRGAGLTEGVGGSDPFLALLDALVDMIRSMVLGEEKTIYYRGFDHFGKEFGVISDAYRIRFAVGTLRPMFNQFGSY